MERGSVAVRMPGDVLEHLRERSLASGRTVSSEVRRLVAAGFQAEGIHNAPVVASLMEQETRRDPAPLAPGDRDPNDRRRRRTDAP